jgi:hypothetical protein
VTRSAYIVGGAGTGKSTFTGELLDALRVTLGPLEDLHTKPNRKSTVRLRGHYAGPDGLYLGCMRESFPGTDGLDRVSSPVGVEWLQLGLHDRLGWIVGEGATLCTKPFLAALADHTDLLLVHLHAAPEVKAERFTRRGSDQAAQFVKATATRALNRYVEARASGVRTLSIDTADDAAWELGLEIVETHLHQ